MKCLTSLLLLPLSINVFYASCDLDFIFPTVFVSPNSSTDETSLVTCRHTFYILNGNVTVEAAGLEEVAVVTCYEDYDLYGPSRLKCVQGEWVSTPGQPVPTCVERCKPPPRLDNGNVQVEGTTDKNGLYRKGKAIAFLGKI